MDAILEQIRRAPSILDVFSLADELTAWAAGLPGSVGAADRDRRALLDATRDRADAPTAIAAAHALARLPGTAHDAWLVELMGADELLGADGWLAPHVAWSLAERRPAGPLVAPLVGLVEAGRSGGMLAQRTLARWAADGSEPIAATLAERLRAGGSPAGRARLIETIGLVGGADRRLRSASSSMAPEQEC